MLINCHCVELSLCDHHCLVVIIEQIIPKKAPLSSWRYLPHVLFVFFTGPACFAFDYLDGGRWILAFKLFLNSLLFLLFTERLVSWKVNTSDFDFLAHLVEELFCASSQVVGSYCLVIKATRMQVFNHIFVFFTPDIGTVNVIFCLCERGATRLWLLGILIESEHVFFESKYSLLKLSP